MPSLRTTPCTISCSTRLPVISCSDAQPYYLSFSFWCHSHTPTAVLPQLLPRRSVETLQLAHGLAHRSRKERVDEPAVVKDNIPFPTLKPGDQVLMHRPHHENDDPNSKLYSPGHGPYTVRTERSPIIYSVTKDGETSEPTSISRSYETK